MSLSGTLLGYALTAFILLLIAPLVLDWAQLLQRPWMGGPGPARLLMPQRSR